MDLSKYDKMNRFKLLYFVIFIISLYEVDAQISDKRLCVDEECKVPISLAKTLLRYSSPDSRILSFAPNVDITIYSKSAGSREDLWGGEINGKRGYVPKHMVRETKVLQKPTLLVNTEFSNETDSKEVPSQVEPNNVQEPYEVVDGTTIYLNPQDDISPSSTESPIQSTVVPSQDETSKFTGRSILSSEPLQPEAGKPSDTQNEEKETTKNEDIVNPVNVESTNQGNNLSESTREQPTIEEASKDQMGVKTADPEPVSEENVSQNEEVLSAADKQEELEEDDADIDIDEENEGEDDDEDEESENEENVSSDNMRNTETVVPTDSKENVSSENVEKKEEIKFKAGNELNLLESKEDISNEKEPVVRTESKSEIVEPKTIDVNVNQLLVPTEEEKNVSKVEENVESPKEDIISLDIEATTLSPEIEVPQPFDDSIVSVTPNPVESVSDEPKIQLDGIPTLPPLGLFGSPNAEPVQKVEVTSEVEVKPETEQEKFEESKEDSKMVEDALNKLQEEKEEVKGGEEVPIQMSEEKIEVQNSEEKIEMIEEKIEQVPTDSEEIPQGSEKKIDEEPQNSEEVEESGNSGFFSGMLGFMGLGPEENKDEEEQITKKEFIPPEEHMTGDDVISKVREETFCESGSCPKNELSDNIMEAFASDLFNFNSNILLYLVTTAISVIIFLFGYIALDKSRREGPLIAKINSLEKELLIIIKENQILQEKLSTDSGYETNDRVPNEVVENLKRDLLDVTNIKNALEEQVQSLEKELENSTEVGMELNRMLTEILSSEGGSDVLKANVENLQRQLVEQQATINSVNETLAVTNTENHELRLELELSNKKVLDLQAELDKLLLNILKIEEEKETQQSTLENEVATYRQKFEEVSNKLKLQEDGYSLEIKQLKNQIDQTERKLELKSKEHDQLKNTLKQVKSLKNYDESTLRDLLEVTDIKAEVEVLRSENQRFSQKLQQEQELKSNFEKKAQSVEDELRVLKEKYDETDKLRVESQTKLEVLSNYFKDREAQWQKEISKHEALWAEKEGEASSTTERIKFMQEQLQNYKAQTESLKQEIMSQEIELKSQISVLEKKAHENWVSARQAERKLEEAKQEAAQLRHRLTLRERALQEDKRLQSPIEQNGDIPESPASPPLLYGTRDHITKSPPLPGLPPFLPPPHGVPFMPPPLPGVPPFIPPPPPNMFPGDHRPPPLGRMSSPPLNSRYSPSSRGYSPYDRNSSSPSDSEYGTSPPHRRGYSPFRGEDRRDYKRAPPGRTNGRSMMKGGSSGSGHSNESLEKTNRQQSKV
ncbi:transport and Golgi organization protein 1-like [Tribolium madens]|uniref:transport and Golgi organization protein 1-like n=1 Tax=Tribolium madens TaxID=41895 RepID=UPI001CF73350|nr:transport and Golgi organization protein 1-like [Tribolium madens]